MSAQGGSYLHTALSKIGWYRIITTTSDAAGLFTIYHHYGSGGPSSLKLLVTFDYHSPALKCIECTGEKYNSQITNVRMIKTSDDKYCLDVFYNINYNHDVAIDFINTGRYEVILQEPIYLSETDDLSEGETLLTPMEYLNPPMELGVEYRTTERYLGEPVYIKLINLGSLPNAGSTKQISVRDLSIRVPISMDLTWGNFASENFVVNDYAPYVASAGFDNANINIVSGPSSDTEHYEVYAFLKYSKSN